MSIKNWISLHIPTPHYMSMSHVGVDISSTVIHIAEIKRNGSHLELGKYGAEQLEAPVNYNESLTADIGLVNALKKMQKEYHLQFVEVSIPEEHAYIFTADLPMGDESLIRNHIELHLEENVPISLDDAVFDYHVIEKPFEIKESPVTTSGPTSGATSGQASSPTSAPSPMSSSSNASTGRENGASISSSTIQATTQVTNSFATQATNSSISPSTRSASNTSNNPATAPGGTEPVSVSAPDAEAGVPVALPDMTKASSGPTFLASVSVVPKSLIDQYIELFETAGMTPVSFLVENQAVSKCVIKKGDLRAKLIVHVGDHKTVLSIVSKGSVQFTSTVNIGSEDFTVAIMKEFNVSREEAIRMKTERGFLRNDVNGEKNNTSIFLSLINTASALKDEIDRIVLYWQSYVGKRSNGTDGSIEGIILSGRDSLINGFKEYLRATVRLPVDTSNVWVNVYDLDKKIPNIDYIDSLDYAVAIGLGLPKLGEKSH